MNLKTKFHDSITIEASDILKFPKGIPGFEDEKEFVILDLIEPYKVLQSIKTEWVAFIMASPWIFEANYEFDLSEFVLEQLEIGSEEDVTVYNFLTLPKDLKKATMNLIAPVVIHKEKGLGAQIVLENTDYTTKHPVGIEGC